MALMFEAIRGRVLDTDSHEQLSPDGAIDAFGDRLRRWRELPSSLNLLSVPGPNSGFEVASDTAELTQDEVWTKKMNEAPGTGDMTRRRAVLDVMGIDRALIFPGMATLPMIQALGGLGGVFSVPSAEDRALAWDVCEAQNEWASSFSKNVRDRMWMVGVLPITKEGATPEWLVQEANRLLKMGLRGFQIPVGHAPAGLSPADPALDKFYATVAEANVPLLSHPPSSVGFTSAEWLRLNYALGNSHIGVENYLSMMIVGGVFERHPTLRFGAIETGASWIGPTAERLDFSSVDMAEMMGQPKPKILPSEVLSRNVRVAALGYEPVEIWLERYPEIQDVYCYSSDYPHVEGRKWSLRHTFDRVAPLGEAVVNKFFCENAKLLMPS